MTIRANRAVLAHPWLTGVSRHHLSVLIEELARPWATAVEDRRHRARGGARKRAAWAGARHRLVFVDRLVATSIHLRHDPPHAVLGLLFDVDRSTITRAVERTSSPMPTPKTSNCGWTPPRSRCAGPRRAGAVGGRSSRARGSRTR